MAFKEQADLDCTETVSLGGTNNKTGKKNPTSIEGFFIGSRKVESAKAKTGFCFIHVFQTAKGNVGVWGKTNLDQKLSNATPGVMTRITFVGMQPTKNNPMYKYKFEVDADNTIDVSTADLNANSATEEEDDVPFNGEGAGRYPDYSAEENDEDETSTDEIPAARALPPRQAAKLPTAETQSKVQDLLNRHRATAKKTA